MVKRLFQQIDVFGTGPFSGNPLAVVVDADGLSTEQMASISAWTNLSECTFLLPPTRAEADYRVRIFNLAVELPFAGHPTLGSARAWLASGGRGRRDGLVVQECGAGLVAVCHDGEHLAFAAPPLVRSGAVDPDDLERFVAVVGLDPAAVVDAAWVDNGPGWVGILVDSAETALSLAPGAPGATGAGRLDIGVVGPHPAGHEAAYEVRAFFSDDSGALREDPVTGSLNASLAQWLVGVGRVTPPYLATQGTRLGRAGRISVTEDAGEIWIGGRASIAIEGTIDTPP